MNNEPVEDSRMMVGKPHGVTLSKPYLCFQILYPLRGREVTWRGTQNFSAKATRGTKLKTRWACNSRAT